MSGSRVGVLQIWAACYLGWAAAILPSSGERYNYFLTKGGGWLKIVKLFGMPWGSGGKRGGEQEFTFKHGIIASKFHITFVHHAYHNVANVNSGPIFLLLITMTYFRFQQKCREEWLHCIIASKFRSNLFISYYYDLFSFSTKVSRGEVTLHHSLQISYHFYTSYIS